jgi:uncharacterized membrane protein YdjX (TVP38/TMEM64 family)
LRRDAAWLAAIAVALALAAAGTFWAKPLLQSLRHTRGLGAAAPLAFIVVHAVGVMAFVPATVFAVAAGALFGFSLGVVYAFVGGTLGAVGAFLAARLCIRRLLAGRFSESAQLAAIDRAIADNGTRILFLLRLSPITPFNVLNYALGAGTVSLRDFVVSTIGGLPGTILAAYAGDLAGEALALAGETHPVWNSSYYVALGAGFLATVLAVVVVGRAARRALRNVA